MWNRATQLNHTLASLLRDLTERVDSDDKQRIEDALDDAEDDLISQATSPSLVSLGKRHRKQSSNGDDNAPTVHGEAHVTASAGSNEDLDHLDEDLMRTRESRETGYVGQNSEVQWLRSVQRQTENTGAEPRQQPYGPPGAGRNAVSARADALHERRNNKREASRQGSMPNITDSSFYLDSDNIEVDIVVDPYEMPEPEAAERLLECYYTTVHPSFPLVPDTYRNQYRKYMASIRKNEPYHVPQKWRAQMNLLFAIGAKYSHLINVDWAGDERDHLVYMTRAVHLLGLKNTVMIISGPDLSLVQATGALSFYFLAIGHVSRAWVMIGVSIRLALALGLHLRNEDPAAGESRKEALVHTWWNLHSIECLVSTITGRPPVIAFEDCTVPLPRSFPGEHHESPRASRQASRRRTEYTSPQSSTPSLASDSSKHVPPFGHYLIGHIKVTLIVQKALLNLYSPRTAAQSWEFIQGKISEMLTELEEWATTALPDGRYGIGKKEKNKHEREQFLLKTDYWSTKMLITRPCLCRIERRIRNESSTSASFNTTSAEACVEAALEMVKLLPDHPDLDFLYSTGPWWAMIHIIMQSMAVLLLEMAYGNKDMRGSDPNMTTSIKKLIRWLRAMRHDDPVAARAYQVTWKILKACAPTLQAQANDLLAMEGEDDSPSNTCQYPAATYDEHNTAHWPQANFYHPPVDNSSAFVSPTFDQSTLDPLTAFPYDSNTFYTADQNPQPMVFGNPFFTSFDQGAPVVDIQDLWIQGTSGAHGSNLSHLDIAQDQHGIIQDTDMDSSLHQ
ncbi:fungal-specific transcription factor domain-containing protein [Paraphoma chrysanthemicola]|uniref:Fungal-specific transcription factor domain-containing protein n=1 Tax=Paraphoma chrysanthemicola TaxID=798071 RepID=A0A8K0RF90_9PLEO|nr:fungal-specific transcription factor domain-containing protein [Paraphoma chrysanthemicola]